MLRAQQARLRAMVEAQLRNGTGSQDHDAALLRELERRLRADVTQQSDVDELMQQLQKRLLPKSNKNQTTKPQQQPKYSIVPGRRGTME
jgi:hypothetical protein